ncbi:carboxymuconolactone decarboxylase family protein [uncultured Sphingomonas sp.]|uniref:carboxymuconolactone decarboxylase family protein n=1 Tax=uncultured Sphingomonas sp. TaxID=158754 RepID=UPI0035CA5C6F
MSFAIGEVWDRPQLAPKSRELAMIAALAALGRDGYPQLRLHVRYALNFGATPAELREIVYLTLVTAGLPKALNVAPEVRAVVGDLPPDEPAATDVTAASRQVRGEATLASLNGGGSTDIAADAILGPLAEDFPLLVGAALSFAFGDVWSRAILDPVDRQLAAVAAFAAIGADAWPQMRPHAAYALRLGASAEAIKEVLAITIVSAGLPKALNAAIELRPILAPQDGDHDA